MKWMDEKLKEPKPKKKLHVLDPTKVVKKKKPKTQWVMEHNQAERQWKKKDLDSIPPGTLCQVRKNNQKWLGFDICTVLRTFYADGGRGQVLYAEVLDFQGKIHNVNALWLRNDTVQNGNIDEE